MELNNNVEVVEVKRLTIMEKLKYFFINPNKLFEDYNTRPTWFLKTLIIIALTIIGTTISTKLMAGSTIDMMIQQSPDMSREQAEVLMKSPLVIGFAVGGALVVSTAAVFLGSLIYYGLISLFGGKTNYIKIVSVYSLAYIPYTIGTMISLAFAYYTNNFDSMMQPQVMDVIFNRLDIFVIWQVLLLVFGFAKISNLKLHKSAIIVAIMWTIATAISLIPVFMNRLF
ncbi:MAG TPA: Yip1 family protein [Methanosarcinales archaeon]|nr:Yip1 family protein [Methanosarcinales archaeon]